MRTQLFARTAGAAAFALVFWQCGGGDNEGSRTTSAARSDRVDACELVQASEVETIIGASIASAKGNFSEHTYTKPVNYTASCMYMGERAVMLAVTYPVARGKGTSEQLAARITEQLRSQVGSDPSTDELFKTTQVRPVEGFAGPAAEYTMLEQTTLEVHAGEYTLKVMAPSLEGARGVVTKAVERLD
jgi:hypothetical protein